uniref:Uncharacterized protein n=1 Tax=Haptolina brevifila TaxID=156173 RepID=A0A7S2J8Q6_9EUKA|mmetsp:Transcript_7849/g.15982  ORF Transcript_7849/g.15982 Transcript_7849/m.15982 type:complete len:226 (+) Transcript_7849:10-687(+)
MNDLFDWVVALKVLACLVACWVAYKFIVAAKPTSSSEGNPFLKKKKVQAVERPKFLYRLARESEPTRNAKGDVVKEGALSENDRNVGVQAAHQLSLPPERRLAGVGGYFGVPEGVDSSCLHLSTADQVPSTCNLYFEGVDDLILLKFSRADIEKDDSVQIKWEEAMPKPGKHARKGDFPHLYSPHWGKAGQRISWRCLTACTKLPIGADGERVFPPGCLSEDSDQ